MHYFESADQDVPMPPVMRLCDECVEWVEFDDMVPCNGAWHCAACDAKAAERAADRIAALIAEANRRAA